MAPPRGRNTSFTRGRNAIAEQKRTKGTQGYPVGAKKTAKRSSRGKGSARPPQEKKLFTERLKGSGKWVFLVLAIVFASSFVLFGVGSSGSVGLQDILQSGGDGSAATTEVSSADLAAALAAVKAKPADATAWVTLGKAYQATASEDTSANRTKLAQTNYDKAVAAYVKASTLNKTGVELLKGLAGAYVAQTSALQTEIATLQNKASLVQAGASPGSTLLPTGLNTPDAVSAAANTQISEQVTALQAQAAPLQTAADKATLAAYDVWKRLTTLQPDDPAVWFEFAGAAVSAASGIDVTDTAKLDATKASAILGYKKFLELAPGDPLAAQVQAAVDQLEGKTDTTATTGTGATTDTAAATTTAAGTTATTP